MAVICWELPLELFDNNRMHSSLSVSSADGQVEVLFDAQFCCAQQLHHVCAQALLQQPVLLWIQSCLEGRPGKGTLWREGGSISCPCELNTIELLAPHGHEASMLWVVQERSRQQYDDDYKAYKAGKYQETAETWLSSSWQGDALQVGSSCHLIPFQGPWTCSQANVLVGQAQLPRGAGCFHAGCG